MISSRHRPQDSLARLRRCRRMVPQTRQLGAQCRYLRALGVGDRRRLSCREATRRSLSRRADLGETFIPASFEIPGDQTIFRIDRIVLSMRASRLVSRLFQRKFLLSKRIRAGSLAIRDRRDGGFQAERRDRPQHLRRDRGVDAHVAERDADAAPPVIDVGVIAHVAGDAALVRYATP